MGGPACTCPVRCSRADDDRDGLGRRRPGHVRPPSRCRGAETVARRVDLPGLVDAHCHVGLDAHGAVDDGDQRGAGAGRPRRRRAAAARRRRRRPTPAGSTTATTCRGWSGPGGTSPGPSATSATSPTRSSPRTSRPTSRVEAAARRRLGQARRRLDRPRRRRPHALLAGRRRGGGDRRGPRARRPGHRALLRRGLDRRPGRGRHRLHRARHRADRRHHRRDGRRGVRDRPDAGQHRRLPGDRRRGAGALPARTPRTCATCTRAATPTLRAAYEAGVPVYVGTDAGGCCRTGWSPARC